MKRKTLELRKMFKTKVASIEKLLDTVSKEDLLSEQRKEFLALVAVELRAMFCYSGGDPLMKTAEMTQFMIFPLYDRLTPFNELSDLILVENDHIKDNVSYFRSSTSIELDGLSVPSTWLSYYGWINQIVIDFKTEGYPPLSRAEIIKIVANKNGAHVDPKGHQYLDRMNPYNNGWFVISINGEGQQQFDVDCGNILCETVYSIAKEVVFSYKYLNKPPIMWPAKPKSDFNARVYDYSDEKTKRYKFTVCTPDVRQYSTNRLYPCTITDFPVHTYDLLFKNRTFFVEIINVEEDYWQR